MNAPLVKRSGQLTARFRALTSALRGDLRGLALAYARGETTYDEAYERASRLLLEGHANASWLGRLKAGMTGERSDSDFLMGVAKRDREILFWARFLDDVDAGRYLDDEGELQPGPIETRANLYGGGLRGTANESFVDASDDGEEFDWVLGAEDHCEDCPRIAAESPWTKEALPFFPGDGSTQCLSNCGCVLVRRSDGERGFERS